MRKSDKSPATLILLVVFVGFIVLVLLVFDSNSGDHVPQHMPVNIEDVDRHSITLGPTLKSLLGCRDTILERESVQYGEYWLVRNLIRGTESTTIGCADAITYTTIGDYTFVENLPMLVTRWLGPISFAIFAPGDDLEGALDSIHFARNCLPESDLIRKHVSFHLFFPAKHMPARVPHSERAAIEWMPTYEVCEAAVVAPYADVDRSTMYKSLNNMTFPINVARNIARKAANTYFILSSDIELIPSQGMANKFLQMVEDNPVTLFGGNASMRVFPLPVFELHKNVTAIPATKPELQKLLAAGLAIPFHAKVCKVCHLVPGHAEWVKDRNDSGEMTVFSTAKRVGKFKMWEPFYISDNREPYFDERVTWEGQSNKRIQNYAMCLLDYEYHVLNPSFLVHRPGIKHFNAKDPRLTYVPAMNKLIKTVIQPEYKILYGNNKECRL